MNPIDVISEEQWAWIVPLLPSSAGKRGGQWRDHRQVLAGIAWKFRTRRAVAGGTCPASTGLIAIIGQALPVLLPELGRRSETSPPCRRHVKVNRTRTLDERPQPVDRAAR